MYGFYRMFTVDRDALKEKSIAYPVSSESGEAINISGTIGMFNGGGNHKGLCAVQESYNDLICMADAINNETGGMYERFFQKLFLLARDVILIVLSDSIMKKGPNYDLEDELLREMFEDAWKAENTNSKGV